MKKHRTSRLRHRPLFVEGLETRAMLAGNVTASVRGSTLFVSGDNLDNSVVIQQTGPSRFTVAGAPGSDTSVNRRTLGTAFVANNVRNFEIDLRGGNDSLGISNSDVYLTELQAEFLGGPQAAPGLPADALTLRGYANIRTGLGDDAIAVQLNASANIFVDSNAGSDAVVVEGSTATALLINADTGNQSTDGDDFVRVRDVVVTRGALVINTFAGNDNILLTDSSAVAVVVNAGVAVVTSGALDFDNISAARLETRGDILFFGGANVDNLNFSDLTGNFLLVIGGRGGDAINVARLDVRGATLIGELGNDVITLDDSINVEDPATPVLVDESNFTSVTGLLHIDTGAGDDEVNVVGDFTFAAALGALNVWTYGGNDTVSLTNLSLTGNVLIDLGSGNDDLTMDAVATDAAINAFLLDGDDTATITATTAAGGSRARFYGGAGFDTFTDGGGNGVEGSDYFLFEFEEVIDLLVS